MTDQTPVRLAGAMPEFLARARIPSASITADVPPQQYIDDLMLPRGVCTMLSTAGGSGKTTSGLSAAVRSAADGTFRFFGECRHISPLKTMLVLGEETSEMVSRKLAHEVPGGIDDYNIADENGRIAVISWIDYAMRQSTPEKLFDVNGALTKSGTELWKAIKEYKPDFLMFDTLSSLSDGDYLQDRVAYTTLRELNHLASITGAALIMTSHLVKGGSSKIDEHSSADDLIALSRGSAAIVNAARHAVVLLPAPPGAFPGIETQEGEEVWVAGVKSNVGFSHANKTFPVVRSRELRTFIAHRGDALIADQIEKLDRAIHKQLMTMLPRIIRAGSELFRPFVRKPSSAVSLEKLSQGSLAPLFPEGCTPAHITRSLAALTRERKVLECTATRSGAGEVWDYPGGFYQDETRYEEILGEKLRIFKGAADADALKARIEELAVMTDSDLDSALTEAWEDLQGKAAIRRKEESETAEQKEEARRKRLKEEEEAKERASKRRIEEADHKAALRREELERSAELRAEEIRMRHAGKVGGSAGTDAPEVDAVTGPNEDEDPPL